MRKNFAQALRSGGVEPEAEYSRLYALFYEPSIRYNKRLVSIHALVDEYFTTFRFRGTCILLKEFERKHGFVFEEQPQDFDVELLVRFAEYIYNMVQELQRVVNETDPFNGPSINYGFVFEQIMRVIELVGYMQAEEDGFAIFVEKSHAAVAVAEILPAPSSYKAIAYNHYSMRGDLEAKRSALLSFADLLEPQRKTLETIDRQFASDLFYAFNNFNVRHNNIDPSGSKYKKPIGGLSEEQLEHWYDEIYQMSLLAFLRLEHGNRKNEFDSLKSLIEGT